MLLTILIHLKTHSILLTDYPDLVIWIILNNMRAYARIENVI